MRHDVMAQSGAFIAELLDNLDDHDSLCIRRVHDEFQISTLKHNAAMTVSISSTPPMTEVRAREILSGDLNKDGSFVHYSVSLDNERVYFGTDSIEFSVGELEAIAWWMRNKKVMA